MRELRDYALGNVSVQVTCYVIARLMCMSSTMAVGQGVTRLVQPVIHCWNSEP